MGPSVRVYELIYKLLTEGQNQHDPLKCIYKYHQQSRLKDMNMREDMHFDKNLVLDCFLNSKHGDKSDHWAKIRKIQLTASEYTWEILLTRPFLKHSSNFVNIDDDISSSLASILPSYLVNYKQILHARNADNSIQLHKLDNKNSVSDVRQHQEYSSQS